MRWVGVGRLLGLAALVTAVGLACSGDADESGSPASVPLNESLCLDGDRADEPVVDLIDEALDVVDELYGAPQRYFEVAADRNRVSLIVAIDDGTAEQVFYCGEGGRTRPESLGEAEGATFPAGAVDVDPDSIFVGIADQLDDPDIVDLAITGVGDDDVVYDATVLSGSGGGGVLLVLLAPDGEVLAVQAQ